MRDHLRDFVEFHAIEIEGIVCQGSGWRIGAPLQAGHWRQFYVCPRTGLLCRIKPHKQPHREQPVEVIAIDDRHEYRLMDGIWYLVEYRPITSETRNVRDVVTLQRVELISGQKYAARRRQLNKREIARLRRTHLSA